MLQKNVNVPTYKTLLSTIGTGNMSIELNVYQNHWNKCCECKFGNLTDARFLFQKSSSRPTNLICIADAPTNEEYCTNTFWRDSLTEELDSVFRDIEHRYTVLYMYALACTPFDEQLFNVLNSYDDELKTCSKHVKQLWNLQKQPRIFAFGPKANKGCNFQKLEHDRFPAISVLKSNDLEFHRFRLVMKAFLSSNAQKIESTKKKV
jgi:hypothetical protein